MATTHFKQNVDIKDHDGSTVGLTLGGTLVTKTAAQINALAPLASPTFTGTVVLPSTTSIGTVSSTEIGYLDNVTSAIQTQLNGKVAVAQSIVDTTASTLVVVAATHAGKLLTLNRAAGIAVTLPAATGTGNTYVFFVGTAVTSNTITITSAASEYLAGTVTVGASAVAYPYQANGTSHRVITLNGTTSGGLKGDKIILTDIGTALWSVEAVLNGSGLIVTPLS